MRLERLAAGHYRIENGGASVFLERQLNRRWNVTPGNGVNFQPAEVASYTDAKLAGEAALKRAAFVKADTPASRARAALSTADKGAVALANAEGSADLAKQIAAGFRLIAEQLETVH